MSSCVEGPERKKTAVFEVRILCPLLEIRSCCKSGLSSKRSVQAARNKTKRRFELCVTSHIYIPYSKTNKLELYN